MRWENKRDEHIHKRAGGERRRLLTASAQAAATVGVAWDGKFKVVVAMTISSSVHFNFGQFLLVVGRNGGADARLSSRERLAITDVGVPAMTITSSMDISLHRLLLLDALGRWVPSIERTANLDEVLDEFTNVLLVHTDDLSLVGAAQAQAGNDVHDLADDRGDDEDVGTARADVGELDVELLEVALHEASGDGGVDFVQGDDVVGGEDAVEEETDDTCDTVLTEQVESVVDADPVLDLGSIIAADAGNDAQDDAGPRWDHAGAWGSSDETGDGSGTEADHGVLAVMPEIEQAPYDTGEGRSDTGVPSSDGGTKVCTKSGASVEADPSEPKHERSEGDERDVMGTEVDELAFSTSAENPGVSETAQTGADLDRASTSVVEHTPFESPTVDVPNPARDGCVDDGGPNESEDHGGENTTTLGHRAHQDGHGNGRELELVERVEELRDQWGAGTRCVEHISQSDVVEVADESVGGAGGEGERVTPEVPLEDDHGVGSDYGPEKGESALSSCEASVEEPETGDHEEDECAADQDEGYISLVEG